MTHTPAPFAAARHRSRPQIGLLAMYAVVAVMLLGSVGAGVVLSGSAQASVPVVELARG